MGREQPSVAMLPNHTRRAERAKRAKETLNKSIPEMLRASPRVRHGIHKAELIVDPPALSSGYDAPGFAELGTHIKIRLQCTDTLSAAAKISERPFAIKRTASSSKAQLGPNVAILNMASPLRPGGGFLDGANSQEEFLCARTSLYASLWDSFYRLPELGGIHTPDVMVFRDSTPEANDIVKRDRYFIDVISAGMIRFPETRGRGEDRAAGCSCGVSYCDQDRELVTRKMKAVMRIAESKGSQKLVLGAWGCGAYGNPVKEVAKIWRKVIAGSPRQRRPNAERWAGIKEIVFAIPDRGMLREFEKAFGDVLCTDPVTPPSEVATEAGAALSTSDSVTAELISKIAETELQIEQIVNPRSRLRLREVLAQLNKDLARGLANKAAQEEDLTLQEDEELEDFVVSGFLGSDGEDNSFYNFDENDIASDSSDAERSEIYEFRPRQTGSTPRFGSEAQIDDDNDDQNGAFSVLSPSPHFDAQTGWFSGSMDQLTRMLRLNHSAKNSSHSSMGSPVLRPDSGGHDLDELTIDAYLNKYGGTDADIDVPALE